MFGEINSEEIKGIIPRAIRDIFNHINSNENEVEYVISVSMLEIYRENLYDLLSINQTDLKIKENPAMGVYIQGLTQFVNNTMQKDKDLNRILLQSKSCLKSSILEWRQELSDPQE